MVSFCKQTDKFKSIENFKKEQSIEIKMQYTQDSNRRSGLSANIKILNQTVFKDRK